MTRYHYFRPGRIEERKRTIHISGAGVAAKMKEESAGFYLILPGDNVSFYLGEEKPEDGDVELLLHIKLEQKKD